jgi:hypothetical protein
VSTVALTVEGLVVPTNGWVCDTRATVEGSSLRPCLRLAHHGREGGAAVGLNVCAGSAAGCGGGVGCCRMTCICS